MKRILSMALTFIVAAQTSAWANAPANGRMNLEKAQPRLPVVSKAVLMENGQPSCVYPLTPGDGLTPRSIEVTPVNSVDRSGLPLCRQQQLEQISQLALRTDQMQGPNQYAGAVAAAPLLLCAGFAVAGGGIAYAFFPERARFMEIPKSALGSGILGAIFGGVVNWAVTQTAATGLGSILIVGSGGVIGFGCAAAGGLATATVLYFTQD